ncbi:MAG: 3-deoxy-D-manno-octulosonic acid transferase [Acidobacteria bacterium]|nr:3-deoxy-D-manno-octulosonic acid transferase [Acidobacteriota bacterium]
MYFTYTFVLTIGLIIAFPYYVVRFRKYLPTLTDRLGFLKLPQLRKSIWVHAVSVGEVKSVEKLIDRLRKQYPNQPIVVSTATPLGQHLARQRKDIIDHTFYFPLDLPSCVARTLDRIDPQLMIIAETEIWPNFLRACRRRGVPVVMINGRISDRSFPRYKLLRRWLPRVFADYTMLGMQSEIDRRRIEEIGASPEKVTVFGNLKYDVDAAGGSLDPILADLLKHWENLWIAASTMPGEEELVLEAFKGLRGKFPDLKLMIAPRHPERSGVVDEMVRRAGFVFAKRTALAIPSPGALLEASPYRARASRRHPLPEGEGLILDTIGELAAAFEYAKVVFMGGTLVARGGHNILEPARHAKPIIFGPHMENFRDMSRIFLDGNAAIQIRRAVELAPAVARVLQTPALAAQLGNSARRIVDENSGATEKVLRYLEPVGASR